MIQYFDDKERELRWRIFQTIATESVSLRRQNFLLYGMWTLADKRGRARHLVDTPLTAAVCRGRLDWHNQTGWLVVGELCNTQTKTNRFMGEKIAKNESN